MIPLRPARALLFAGLLAPMLGSCEPARNVPPPVGSWDGTMVRPGRAIPLHVEVWENADGSLGASVEDPRGLQHATRVRFFSTLLAGRLYISLPGRVPGSEHFEFGFNPGGNSQANDPRPYLYTESWGRQRLYRTASPD